MNNDLSSSASTDGQAFDAGDTDDCLLIAAAQGGDRAAFSALIERHQRSVYGYLRARLLEPADAEDLCQEVFLRCYTANARFDAPHLVGPWLIGIARNLLREQIRRVKRRRERAWTEMCLELEAWYPPDYERTDHAIHLLPDCLDSLGPTAREALDMHYRSGLLLAEIANRLRRSEGAVKLLLFRARQALRLCLTGKLRANDHD